MLGVPGANLKGRKCLLKVFWTALSLRLLLIIFSLKISYNTWLKLPQWSTECSCVKSDDTETDGRSTVLITTRPVLSSPLSFPSTTLISFLDESDEGFDRDFHVFTKLMPFLSYDAERFLRYSMDDLVYATEDSSAFFPLLPFLANIFARCIKGLHIFLLKAGYVTPPLLSKAVYIAASGLIITNIAALFSSLLLYSICFDLLLKRMSLVHLGDGYFEIGFLWSNVYEAPKYDKIEKISYLATILYMLAPGSIHSTAFYTESIFSFLSFLAILFLNRAEDFFFKSRFQRGAYCIIFVYFNEFIAFLLLFLCCGLRSNGLLLLLPLFFYTWRTCPLFSNFNLLLPHYIGDHIRNRRIGFASVVKFTLHWMKALIQAILLQIPMLVFQLYGYVLYCLEVPLKDLVDVAKFTKFTTLLLDRQWIQKLLSFKLKKVCRSWCRNTIPLVYNFVQKEYWHLQFLWVLRDPIRLAELSYSLGTYLIAFFCLRRFYKLIFKLYKELKKDDSVFVVLISLLSHSEFGYVMQLLVTFLTFLLYAQMAVIMRQSLLLPSYLLHSAIMAERICHVNHWKLSNIKYLDLEITLSLVLLLKQVSLFYAGATQFANYLGWT